MNCNVCITGETLLGKIRNSDTELVKWSGEPAGLSEVRWTRTTIDGPNDLGGSVKLLPVGFIKWYQTSGCSVRIRPQVARWEISIFLVLFTYSPLLPKDIFRAEIHLKTFWAFALLLSFRLVELTVAAFVSSCWSKVFLPLEFWVRATLFQSPV
jgi:hypothetical protein